MDPGSSNPCCSRNHCNYTATIAKGWPREASCRLDFGKISFFTLILPCNNQPYIVLHFISKLLKRFYNPFVHPAHSLPFPEPFLPAKFSFKCISPILFFFFKLAYKYSTNSWSPSPLSSKWCLSYQSLPLSGSLLFPCLSDFLHSSLAAASSLSMLAHPLVLAPHPSMWMPQSLVNRLVTISCNHPYFVSSDSLPCGTEWH